MRFAEGGDSGSGSSGRGALFAASVFNDGCTQNIKTRLRARALSQWPWLCVSLGGQVAAHVFAGTREVHSGAGGVKSGSIVGPHNGVRQASSPRSHYRLTFQPPYLRCWLSRSSRQSRVRRVHSSLLSLRLLLHSPPQNHILCQPSSPFLSFPSSLSSFLLFSSPLLLLPFYIPLSMLISYALSRFGFLCVAYRATNVTALFSPTSSSLFRILSN